MIALRALFLAVALLFYAGMESYVLEGSKGMHSLHGRLILSALLLLTAGVTCIAIVATTQRRS